MSAMLLARITAGILCVIGVALSLIIVASAPARGRREAEPIPLHTPISRRVAFWYMLSRVGLAFSIISGDGGIFLILVGLNGLASFIFVGISLAAFVVWIAAMLYADGLKVRALRRQR